MSFPPFSIPLHQSPSHPSPPPPWQVACHALVSPPIRSQLSQCGSDSLSSLVLTKSTCSRSLGIVITTRHNCSLRRKRYQRRLLDIESINPGKMTFGSLSSSSSHTCTVSQFQNFQGLKDYQRQWDPNFIIPFNFLLLSELCALIRLALGSPSCLFC